ncbi:MAG: response regulator [Hahellaceae bacterium]|nr:response regulator [Hahellaceae bacterium]
MVLNLFQVLIDYINETNSLDQDIEAIITISHTPASQIAYNIDSRLAEELLEGLLKHPAIIEAEIVDTDNRVLARRNRHTAESTYRWLSDLLFEPTRNYSTRLSVQQLADVDLGNLNVVVDTYPSGYIFLNRAGFTLISGFIKSLSLSFLLLFVFYVMLTKPLLKVINAVSEVDPETPEKTRLPVPKGHQHDEIGILVESTNDHLQTIEKSLQRARKAEYRLKSYSEQLEQIVDSRTRELSEKNDQLIRSNQELVIAKEEAVRRAKARANFLANMSHEIRTPFNGVLGMISLTLEEPLSDRQKRQLEIAYNSGVSLLELLNDILDISKVEAGKLSLEVISFDLRQLAEDVANLLAQNAQAKNIELIADISPEFPEAFMGDPTRLRQVISNLTGNAIKFTEQGSVKIQLSYENGFVFLRVIDTGIGISEDAIEKIFAPFSQAYSDTTRKYGGTGLGLALCRQLVTHMSGQLTVQSNLGKGSSFIARIPLQPDASVVAQDIETAIKTSQFRIISRQHNEHIDLLKRQLQYWKVEKVQTYEYSEVEDANTDWFNHWSEDTLFIIDDPAFNSALESDQQRAKTLLFSYRMAPAEIARKFGSCMHPPLSRAILHKALQNVLQPQLQQITKAPELAVSQVVSPKNYRVLLVEDNQVNQMVAKAILTKLGYKVDIANNGKEAVDILRAQLYDAVLMDCHMPIMDGYEATRAIRKDLEINDLPIIAVTANVMHGDREKCFSAGMNDYITKPYERHVLLEVLDKWINQASSQGATL